VFASSSDLLFGSHPGRPQADIPLNALCRFTEPPLITTPSDVTSVPREFFANITP
jgi:hypothetical protein